MEQVRGSRSDPGLKRQHLACIEAVAALTDAEVHGDTLGSEMLVFEPTVGLGTAATPTAIGVDIATAGSVTLVADTLLPLAIRLREPVSASLTGGTDVRWSPSVDYLRRVKLPLLRTFGLDADIAVERHGFYPAGGGELAVGLRPSSLEPIELGAASADGGSAAGVEGELSIHAVAAAGLEDGAVANRVADVAAAELDDRGIVGDAPATATYADTDSPGAALTVVVTGSGHGGDPAPRAGFVGYGDGGTAAELLAEPTVDAVERWAEDAAPVDAHLADQLVVWLALAGGSVPIPRVTDHVRTNVELVRAFGYDVSIERRPTGPPVVSGVTH